MPSHTYGVALRDGANNNLIGGTGPLAGNLISGNLIGVLITEVGTTNNRIVGNALGTQADRASRLGNLAHGVLVTWGAAGNTIGGTGPGEGNVIAFNGGSGVVVAEGTRISIRGNAIHTNVGLGIDLAFDGVTPNDPGDTDTGPNNLQNYPTLYAAFTDGAVWTFVVGDLSGEPNREFDIDIYTSAAADPSGYGEGERYLGTVTVTTDANGYALFAELLLTPALPGGVLTATATDTPPPGNTSEFSAAIRVELFSGPGGGPGPGLSPFLPLDPRALEWLSPSNCPARANRDDQLAALDVVFREAPTHRLPVWYAPRTGTPMLAPYRRIEAPNVAAPDLGLRFYEELESAEAGWHTSANHDIGW